MNFGKTILKKNKFDNDQHFLVGYKHDNRKIKKSER